MKLAITILIITIFARQTFAQTNKSEQIEDSKPFILGVIDEIHQSN